MRRLVTLLLVVPVTIAVIVLSVANRSAITISLDPIGSPPALSLTAPLFVFLFAAFALGIFFGGIATWIGQRKWRRAARSERANTVRRHQELQRPSQVATASAPALSASPRDTA